MLSQIERTGRGIFSTESRNIPKPVQRRGEPPQPAANPCEGRGDAVGDARHPSVRAVGKQPVGREKKRGFGTSRGTSTPFRLAEMTCARIRAAVDRLSLSRTTMKGYDSPA